MKLNKKMIIPAFALLAGASLVGSISGTIAWYQYSTRANVAYIGSSAGTIGNLQVRINDGTDRGWDTQISYLDVSDYLYAQGLGQKVEPVTPGALEKNDSLRQAKWNGGSDAIAYGDELPAGNEGDYFFKSDESKLYLKGATEWADSGIAVAATAPANLKVGEKYFNSENKKIYEGILKAEWNSVSDEINFGDELPAGSEGDYFFKTSDGKLYLKGETEWADTGIAVSADAPENVNYGDKYFNSTDKKIYQGVAGVKDFFSNPKIGFGPYNEWNKAPESFYVRIPLQLRFIGKDASDLESQNVYLSKLLIQKDRNNGALGDISDAIRVHFSVYADGQEDNANNFLVSKNGGTTLTHGRLKLGRGTDFDKAFADGLWGFDGSELNYVDYGAGSQNSYAAKDQAAEGVYYEEEFSETGWNQVAMTVAAVEPDNANGKQGDFYYDSVGAKLYQKGASEWAEFSDYVSGANDPDLDTERNNKDYYFNSTDKKLFLNGAVEENIDPILVSEKNDNPIVLENTDGRELGNTNGAYLNVDVTIWVEGWQQFNRDGKFTSLWDKNLIGAKFDVGMQFAVQDKNA